MATGEGDSSLENQSATGIIEQRLARGCRLKETGFFACMIDSHLHSRNNFGCTPHVGFHPILGHALRLNKPYLRAEPTLAMRQELFQLTEGRTRAGAAWMNEHHQF